MTNTGGRSDFTVGSAVRVFLLDGQISNERYLVEQPRSDRKGFIVLREDGTQRLLKVHHRRVLPNDANGHAWVFRTLDKFHAVCPKCLKPTAVQPHDAEVKCCGVFPLRWVGGTVVDHDVKKSARVEANTKIDLVGLAKSPHCELWTKKNVKFDHPHVDVQAHVLVFVPIAKQEAAPSRKLCFNTYNGTLGKHGRDLPVEEFVQDKSAGPKKKPWMKVPDLEALRTKLKRDGYVCHR